MKRSRILPMLLFDLGWLGHGFRDALLRVPVPSPERVAALKSDPRVRKSVVLGLGCKNCDSKFTAYAAIEKKDAPPSGAVWYQDAPAEFRCGCGSTSFSLAYVRENLHALLDAPNFAAGNVSYSSMYERQALEQIYRDFLALIEREPPEEELQLFLSANTVLFHFLSPQRIFVKPPILTKFKADYGIWDAKGTLHLVEIERASLPLLRKNGDSSAEFNHAIGQVQSWLHQYSLHQAAILDGLGLVPSQVVRVRGLVIAGRNGGYDVGELQRLKWLDRGDVDFQTYDDLILGLNALRQEMVKV